MNASNVSRIGRQSGSAEVIYSLKPALIVQEDVVLSVHLVATSPDAALTYGAARLTVEASVLLVADELKLPARVGWCDGRRARLENR